MATTNISDQFYNHLIDTLYEQYEVRGTGATTATWNNTFPEYAYYTPRPGQVITQNNNVLGVWDGSQLVTNGPVYAQVDPSVQLGSYKINMMDYVIDDTCDSCKGKLKKVTEFLEEPYMSCACGKTRKPCTQKKS